MKFRPLVLIPLASSLAVISTDANAATANSTLAVSMTVNAGCTVTAGTLAFGTQTSLQSNVDQTGTIQVTCTNTTPYNIGLDQGANGASVTARKMKGGASNTEYINYAMYSNSGRTTNFGNTVSTDTLAGTGNGTAQTITIYGRVPAQTIGSPGAYTDTVNVTVTY